MESDLSRTAPGPAYAPAGALPSLARVRPGALVAAALAVFGAVWLAVLAATSLVAPVDNLEQLVWSRSLQWGYYKHPPLPTFLARAATDLFGVSAWTTYALGASMTLGAMAILWRLLREMRGPRHATIGLLAALCITFYNGRLNYYNHNIVLLLLSTAAAALCWRAFEQRRLRWWLALGVVLGLGALTKYQIAVTVLSLACFWVSQRGWREAVHRRGAVLAALVALALFAPHLLWLPHHDFGPIGYAMGSSLGMGLGPAARTLDALNWLVDALANRCLPAFLLLGVALRSARRLSAFDPGSADHAPDRRARAARMLLLCWGVVPPAFVALTGLVFGADLQLQWGTPFLLFVVPAAMEWRPAAFWNRASQRSVWKAFAAIQVLLVAINVATSPVGLRGLKDTHWRTFSAHELALRIAPAARAQLGGPIAVVAGSTGEAGALALELPQHPLVLLDGRFDRSPWVSRELVAACGALELIHSSEAVAGAQPVGAPFEALWWRVQRPEPDAPPCPR